MTEKVEVFAEQQEGRGSTARAACFTSSCDTPYLYPQMLSLRPKQMLRLARKVFYQDPLSS